MRLTLLTKRSGRLRPSWSALSVFGLAAFALSVAGCNPRPGTTALDANVPLKRDPNLTPGTVVWRSPDLARYEHMANAYYIPPATVYRGSGSVYVGLDQQRQDQVAAELTNDVRAAIGQRFRVVNQPGPGAFTLELILAKVVPPQPVGIQNGPYDFSASVIGMPDVASMSTGIMTVSGKFIDGASGKLLVGFVVPVSPQNMAMEATSNPAESIPFARLASEKCAADRVEAIVRQRARGGQPAAR